MDWVVILCIAISTLGVMSWLRKLVEQIPPLNPTPTIVWVLAMPLVALGLGLLYVYSSQWTMVSITGFSFVQLAKDNIINLVQAKVDAFK